MAKYDDLSQFENTLIDQFNMMPDYSITALFIDTDRYFPAITNTIFHATEQREMGGAYLTITRPARAIMNKLLSNKIRIADIYFIDCISYTVGGQAQASKQVVNLESPNMLETMLLKVDWAFKQIASPHRFVFLDSVNALAIYNKDRILKEFLHVFINRLRARDIFTVLLSVGRGLPLDLEEVLQLTCDETVDLRRNR